MFVVVLNSSTVQRTWLTRHGAIPQSAVEDDFGHRSDAVIMILVLAEQTLELIELDLSATVTVNLVNQLLDVDRQTEILLNDLH